MSKRSPSRYTRQRKPPASALAAVCHLGRKSPTSLQILVVWQVARQAWSGVLAEGLLAASAKAHGVRIDALASPAPYIGPAPTHVAGGVAHGAVAFLVAADAGVEVP